MALSHILSEIELCITEDHMSEICTGFIIRLKLVPVSV